ncbi:MAG: hypothetical protein P8102_02425 [Gammaproteobacteria bacterium]
MKPSYCVAACVVCLAELLGDEINLDDDLNLSKDDTAFRVGGNWRFAKRHRLIADYYSLGRDASAVTEKEIILDDVVFPVGIGVRGGFDVDIVQLAYTYSIIQTDRSELGLSIGVHWPSMNFFLEGVGLDDIVDSDLRAEADLEGPLPLIGADGRYRLLDWLYASGRFQVFSLEYDKYDGRFIDARVALEAWPVDWVGLGLGYNVVDLDFDVDDGRWRGELDHEYRGFRLFLIAQF